MGFTEVFRADAEPLRHWAGVFSPLIADEAAFALNAEGCVRRILFVECRENARRRQAANPPKLLSEFAKPALVPFGLVPDESLQRGRPRGPPHSGEAYEPASHEGSRN
jgi:hypothetical protein